ncbi:MAG: hypothetical protein KME29_28460 [Calothrix sp. FI2-JRJ7]|nr:hypothetical protein [Calothrix sp. FI2-JRJ7]
MRVAESSAAINGEVFCIADEQRPKCIEVMKTCLRATGYEGEIELAPPQEDDITSTWFDQNEFITSRKAHRLLGWVPRHTGIIDEIETYYASWKATQINRLGFQRIYLVGHDIAGIAAYAYAAKHPNAV